MHTYLSLLLSNSNNNSLVQFKELQDEKIGRLQEEVEIQICFAEMRWWGGGGWGEGGKGENSFDTRAFLTLTSTYIYVHC